MGFGICGEWLLLLCILPLSHTTADAVYLNRGTPADVISVQALRSRINGTEDSMVLIDLNSEARAMWGTNEVDKDSINAQFYITSRPSRGKLYQAYRPNGCRIKYPQSCSACCTLSADESKCNTISSPQGTFQACVSLPDSSFFAGTLLGFRSVFSSAAFFERLI